MTKTKKVVHQIEFRVETFKLLNQLQIDLAILAILIWNKVSKKFQY